MAGNTKLRGILRKIKFEMKRRLSKFLCFKGKGSNGLIGWKPNHDKENGKDELQEFSGNAVHSKTCFATR
jgi:hypothetical protein